MPTNGSFMNPNQTESTTKSSNPGTLILRSVGIVFILTAVACFLVSMYGATSAFNTALNSSTAITPAVLASQISESLKASFIAVPFGLIVPQLMNDLQDGGPRR